MAFKLEGVMVIQGATLELSAKELVELADAKEALQKVCHGFMVHYGGDGLDPGKRPAELAALDVVGEFLDACASMIDQAGAVRPKRRSPQPRRKKAS